MTTPTVLAPLATIADVADLRGAPFAQRELDIAAAQVRAECGWHIAPRVEHTLEVDSDGGRSVLLPTLALREVLEVRDRVRAVPFSSVSGGWDFSTAGILTRAVGWPRGPRAVTVRFVHGHDETPLELVALVATLARAARSEATPGVRSFARTVGGITTNTGYTDGDPAASVLTQFAHVLDRYRIGVPV